MASKSKRRRKVLGASCILAALIIAGSSFAWFTSKDEVTNRLSANADYGVSIVESFAPPANWLPGQEVNKDVYATNTGNIGAFVREDVSGALTVTKEKATTAKTANSIKLTEEERYAVEAGAYLAYKPAGSAAVVGEQIVIRPGDKAGSTLTDFTPDVEGLYVFRRTVDVNKTSATEAFEYDGYYFDETYYYKISGLSVVADTTADKAGDNNKTDGNLAAASAGFWENETKVVDPVKLTYVEDPTGYVAGKYLVAEYDTGNYKAEAALIAAADAYDQMIHNYEYLTALATAAQAEANAAGTGTGALGTATTNLNNKQAALNSAVGALNNAQNTLNDAQVAYNDAVAANKYAKQQAYESKTKLFGSSGSTETDGTVTPNDSASASAGSLKKILDDANTAVSGATYDMSVTAGKTAKDAFDAEMVAWFTANNTVTGSKAKEIYDANTSITEADAIAQAKTMVAAMEEFRDWIAAQTANENHDYYAKVAAQTIAQLNYDNEMIKLYGKNDGGETGSSGATPTVGSYTDASLWGKYKTADSDLNTATTGKKDLLGKSTDAANATGSAWAIYNKAVEDLAVAQSEYDAAYVAWAAAAKASGIANDKLAEINNAKTAADTAKTEAQNTYDTATANVGTSDGTLKVYIKLSSDVEIAGGTSGKWQMLPTTVANDTASFYYTNILEGGETSTKLIDSVTLDKNATQDMYKYFDFDLNVALKSVQVTYADDNKTILATATPEELDAIASLATATDIDTAITWSKTTS